MFYGAYPSMAAHKEVVEAKMMEVVRDMPDKPVDEANAEIAERVEAYVKHRQRFASVRPGARRLQWRAGLLGAAVRNTDAPGRQPWRHHQRTAGATRWCLQGP